ncbi:MAG: sulfatase, partial [Verrucomicrobia bacterium]|nr:sulfatase [Verrucomicrobiota bacterium]
MNLLQHQLLHMNRRRFLSTSGLSLGLPALHSLLGAAGASSGSAALGLPELPHFAPKAKRVIYLM